MVYLKPATCYSDLYYALQVREIMNTITDNRDRVYKQIVGELFDMIRVGWNFDYPDYIYPDIIMADQIRIIRDMWLEDVDVSVVKR